MLLRGACKSANPIVDMVHDTENLTFSKEFRGCSEQTPANSCASDTDLLQGSHGSSARADTNLALIRVENGENQMVNFMHNNAEGIEKDIARIVRIIIAGIGLPLISLGPLHNDLLHGKFKTFNRLKRSKADEITTEH